MKNYRSIRSKLYMIAIVAMAVVMAMLVPLTLNAATSITLGGNGTVTFLKALTKEEIQEVVQEQQNELESEYGFVVTPSDDGLSLGMDNNTAESDKEDSSQAAKWEEQHRSMILSGMLRYELYKNNPSQLVVVIDFSNYRVLSFNGNFLNYLTPALFGRNDMGKENNEPVEMEPGTGLYGRSYTYDKDQLTENKAITVYDEQGNKTDLPDNLVLQGINQGGTFEVSGSTLGWDNSEGWSYEQQTSYVEYVAGTRTNLTSYVLRIILPDMDSTITFADESLTTLGINAHCMQVADRIELDVSKITIKKDENGNVINPLDIDADAAAPAWEFAQNAGLFNGGHAAYGRTESFTIITNSQNHQYFSETWANDDSINKPHKAGTNNNPSNENADIDYRQK